MFGNEGHKLAHFGACLAVVTVFENGQSGGGGVGESLAAPEDHWRDFKACHFGESIERGLIVFALGIGFVEHGDGAKAFVERAGFRHEIGGLLRSPQIEAARLQGSEQTGDSERGAQAAGIAASHIDHDVGVLGGELAGLCADAGAIERDGGVSRFAFGFGAEIGEGKSGALFVAVDQQYITLRGGERDCQNTARVVLPTPPLTFHGDN